MIPVRIGRVWDLVDQVRERVARRRTIRALQDLDDRLLDDIGLTRDSIRQAVTQRCRCAACSPGACAGFACALPPLRQARQNETSFRKAES